MVRPEKFSSNQSLLLEIGQTEVNPRLVILRHVIYHVMSCHARSAFVEVSLTSVGHSNWPSPGRLPFSFLDVSLFGPETVGSNHTHLSSPPL